LLGLTVILAGVLRTLSIGAWAGVAAAAVAVTALKGRRWLAGTAAALVVLLFVGVFALPAGRISGRLDPGTGTALFRLQIWSSSLRMVADHPFFGVGLDNFLYRYRDGYMLPEAAEEPNISHPHNWLLHFWLELGLLGVIAAVGLLLWAGRAAWTLVRTPESPVDLLVGAAAIGVFADTLVHGALDNSYFLVDSAVLWWLTIALLAIRVSRRSQDRDSTAVQ
jgi:O-antigen ligase